MQVTSFRRGLNMIIKDNTSKDPQEWVKVPNWWIYDEDLEEMDKKLTPIYWEDIVKELEKK